MSTCTHLDQLKQEGGIRDYEKVLVLVANIPTQLSQMKANLLVQKYKQTGSYICFSTSMWLKILIKFNYIKRVLMSRCSTSRCNTNYGGQMFACLHCIFIGCEKNQHMKAHSKEMNHPIACELSCGTVFCFACCEYIFEPSFEGLRETIQYGRSRLGGNIIHFTEVLNAIKGEVKCVKNNCTIGLRGLVNLGHTCFMNCIVQVLTHTPMLADFFLSERIECTDKHFDKPCMITLMFDIFQQFYSGDKRPFPLPHLLHKMWGNAPYLANSDQQDAHEFLAAILEAIGLHFRAFKMSCAIEGIFFGALKSTVKCMHCGTKSIKNEPFMNISLDVFGQAEITLDECLHRYIQVEQLGPFHAIECKKCKTKQESSKQLEFKRFPLILSFHFKRFMSMNAGKWEHLVQFPLQLNENQFASEEQKEARKRGGKSCTLEQLVGLNYSLYAVIVHEGTCEGGHYIAYIRSTPGTWIKCNDEQLTKVSVAEVLKCKAYMLFYHSDEVPEKEVHSLSTIPMHSLNIKDSSG